MPIAVGRRVGAISVLSDGERLVSAYIRQRRWPRQFEPSVGGRNPDFLCETPEGPVAIEVFEPHLQLPARAGSFDSVAPVLGAFEKRKMRQMQAAANAEIPALVVIASTNSDVPFDTFALGGAMFGRLGVRIPIDSPDDAVSSFLGPGKLRSGQNTSYSALASIARFNPTRWRLDAAWSARSPIDATTSHRLVIESARRRQEICDEMTESGVFDPMASVARLVILRNPYARLPLPTNFGGPHDDQYGVVEMGSDGSAWIRIAEGRRRREVPN